MDGAGGKVQGGSDREVGAKELGALGLKLKEINRFYHETNTIKIYMTNIHILES